MRSCLEEYINNKRIIAGHQAELDSGVVAVDSVKGSMPEFPYVERVIPVYGTDTIRQRFLQERIYELADECRRAEAYVAKVEDEVMRSLLYWHYLQGLSWPKVRKKLRMRDITANALRMRVDTFFKKTS